jgi:hypothetical protein
VLTISGMTAARSFVIPTGTAEGDLISWECITAAPATNGYEMVLIGDTGVTLVLAGTDRTATADDAFRYFIPGEAGVLRWDATASKWRLISDGRIPTKCRMYSNNSNIQTLTYGSGQAITLNVSQYDNAGVTDTTNKRIRIRRTNSYLLTPNIRVTSASDGSVFTPTDLTGLSIGVFYDDAGSTPDTSLALPAFTGYASSYGVFSITGLLSAGWTISPRVFPYRTSGSESLYTVGISGVNASNPALDVVEIL